jgi:extradiol dioxygenase family protein
MDSARAPVMFHHALPVRDLETTRAFYAGLLGCPEGVATARRINFEFFGNHLVTHLVDAETADRQLRATEGAQAGWRHFGVVLEWSEWEMLSERLSRRGADFLLKPHVRHAGEPREEALMFLLDPSGNGVEFKTFRDTRFVFLND